MPIHAAVAAEMVAKEDSEELGGDANDVQEEENASFTASQALRELRIATTRRLQPLLPS